MGPLDEHGELAEFNNSSLFKLDRDLVFTDWVKKVSYILFIYLFYFIFCNFLELVLVLFFRCGVSCCSIACHHDNCLFLMKLLLGALISLHVI